MSKPYIRAPKAKLKGSKYELCEEDKEDFEQEKLIKEWLEREGKSGQLEYKYINRKGTARNTLDTRSVRLDAQMSDDEDSGTYADITPGSDGRALECGGESDEPQRDLLQEISWYLSALGFEQGEIKCLVEKMLKSSIQVNNWLLEKSQIDLELWKQFEPFST